MKGYWKKLGTKTIFEHPRLKVLEDDVELPDGKQTKYMLYGGLEDYVTVIPEMEEKILLMSEYSYPHDEWLWQFPEGGIEADEQPSDAAHRELQEEASLRANKISEVGMNYDHHRRTSRKNYIFSASGLSAVTGVKGDLEEQGIETQWFTAQEVNQMIFDGQIRQKNTLAAWAMYILKTDRNLKK